MRIISVKKLAHLTGHRNALYTLGKLASPTCFCTGGSDKQVVEWDYLFPEQGKLLAKTESPVFSMLIQRDQSQLLLGQENGHITVIDLDSRKETRNIVAHQRAVFDIQESPNHHFIASASGDGSVAVWNSEDMGRIAFIQASEKSARCIAFHPSNYFMAVGFSDFKIRLYSSSDFDHVKTLDAHSNSVFALAFSPGGRYLLSGGRDAQLKIWDADHEFEEIKSIPAHLLHINCIAYNPEGNLFATTSMDKTIKIWRGSDFELLKVIDLARNESHTNCINKLAWLTDRIFTTCSDDKTAMVWEIEVG